MKGAGWAMLQWPNIKAQRNSLERPAPKFTA